MCRGRAVFSASGSDLLGTLNQLVSDLTSGSAANVQADAAALTTALGNVTTQRAGLDSSLSRLTATTTYANTQEAGLKAQQSTLLSADPAAVATDLKSSEVQYQALLAVDAALNKTDLCSIFCIRAGRSAEENDASGETQTGAQRTAGSVPVVSACSAFILAVCSRLCTARCASGGRRARGTG